MDKTKPLPSTTRDARPGKRPSPAPKFTLDVVLATLSKTVFQPFIACLLPLALRALASPYTSTSFIVTAAFAATVCVYHILTAIDERLAYGVPREVDWENEVVIITGGCGGLGGCIAEIYGLRGVSVAVLDVATAEQDDGQESEGVYYYRCDVAELEQIEEVWKRVEEDLGPPTILINNAALTSFGKISGLKADMVRKTFDVNTVSHFMTVRLFLAGLGNQRGGTIVTISSVLGRLGAANLAAYCASKAALTTYHHTLAIELAASAQRVKTILVAPGQLDTQMFAYAKVQGRLQNFMGPVLPAGELAMEIVRMIDAGKGGEIKMPAFATWADIITALPMSLQKGLRWWSGMDQALDHSTPEFECPDERKVVPLPSVGSNDDSISSEEDSE